MSGAWVKRMNLVSREEPSCFREAQRSTVCGRLQQERGEGRRATGGTLHMQKAAAAESDEKRAQESGLPPTGRKVHDGEGLRRPWLISIDWHHLLMSEKRYKGASRIPWQKVTSYKAKTAPV